MPRVVYFDEVGNPTLDDADRDSAVFALAVLSVSAVLPE
jgi:hypothetical protein